MASTSTAMDTDPPIIKDPPIKVWVMSMNRHVSTDEIVRGLNKIEEEASRKECLNKPTRDECIRTMISRLFPKIVMEHKFPKFGWTKLRTGTTHKEYFQSHVQDVALGFSCADTGSLVAMAWAVGPVPQVINIGLDVLKFAIPRNSTVQDFFQSVRHKLTDSEQRDVQTGGTDEVLMRRVLIILVIKQAYINAINQPAGFDFRRINCNMPKEQFTVDGRPIIGWEIRMFKANLGIVRKDVLVEEVYQCCAMIHRGWVENRIYYNDKEGEATEMLNFLKVEQIVKAYDALGKVGAGGVRSTSTPQPQAAAQQQQQQPTPQSGPAGQYRHTRSASRQSAQEMGGRKQAAVMQ